MKLFKTYPVYYMTKCCRSVNVCRKRHPFIGCCNHRKNIGRCCVIPKKKQQGKNIETEGTSYETRSL